MIFIILSLFPVDIQVTKTDHFNPSSGVETDCDKDIIHAESFTKELCYLRLRMKDGAVGTGGGREEVVDNVCGESDQGLVLVNQEL